MQKKTFWIMLATLLLFGGIATATAMAKKSASKEFPMAPLFAEPSIWGDSMIRLESYRGKVVLLNFWATWCPPCQAEIPDLIRLHNDFGDRLVIIGVTLDRGPNAKDIVRDFAKKFGIKYPLIMGNEHIAMRYGGVSAIPTSFVIDKQGRIVEKIIGMRSYTGFLDAVKSWF